MNADTVGVIGLGHIAQRHRKNLRLRFPNARVLAMSATGRTPTGPVEDSDEMVADIVELVDAHPSLVVVASPAPLHARHAIPLLENGVPVLVEKPLAMSMEDADALVAAQQAAGVPAAVGYCLRYLPSAEAVRRCLGEEAIGHPFSVHANVGQHIADWRPGVDYRNTVTARPELGGGVLLELSHEFDYLAWLFGALVVEYAHLARAGELDMDAESIADVVMVSPSGLVCMLHLDCVQRPPVRCCTIQGPQGRLEWDLLRNSVHLAGREGRRVLFEDMAWDRNTMYLNMLEDLVRWAQGEPHRCVTLESARDSLCLVAQAKRRATWGERI